MRYLLAIWDRNVAELDELSGLVREEDIFDFGDVRSASGFNLLWGSRTRVQALGDGHVIDAEMAVGVISELVQRGVSKPWRVEVEEITAGADGRYFDSA